MREHNPQPDLRRRHRHCAFARASRPRLAPRREGAPRTAGLPVTLATRRGRTVTVRPATQADIPLVVDLLGRLSDRSWRLRFNHQRGDAQELRREAARMVGIVPQQRLALIATMSVESGERAVAVVEIAVSDENQTRVGEVGMVVCDDLQGEGLGHALCAILFQAAANLGIDAIRVDTLAENEATRHLVSHLGVPYSSSLHQGELTLLLKVPH